MIHVTCLAHALHRIFRLQFPDVDSLIANVKNIFLKAPIRINTFKELYPDLSLPPQPVITRWGTWLEGADYYRKNLGSIKNVLSELDSSSAMAIEQAKAVMEQHTLKKNGLHFFKCLFFNTLHNKARISKYDHNG